MYKVKIYENDICITVGTISKEQAIRIQDISTKQKTFILTDWKSSMESIKKLKKLI